MPIAEPSICKWNCEFKITLFRVSTSARKVIATSVAVVFCWDFLYAHLTAALASAFGILGKTDLTSNETST